MKPHEVERAVAIRIRSYEEERKRVSFKNLLILMGVFLFGTYVGFATQFAATFILMGINLLCR